MVEPTHMPLKKKSVPADVAGETSTISGGGASGGMDGWQASVESRLQSIDSRLGRIEDKGDRNMERLTDRMDTHLYLTCGSMIAGFISLAGLMAVGFGWF